MIPLLKRFKFGQIQREDGPQSHKSKEGTPTIGGLIFYYLFLFLVPYTASLISGFCLCTGYPWIFFSWLYG